MRLQTYFKTLAIGILAFYSQMSFGQTGEPPIKFQTACFINNTSHVTWFDNQGNYGVARAVFESASHSSKFGTQFVVNQGTNNERVVYYQAPVLAEFRYYGEVTDTYFGNTKIGEGSCRGIDNANVFLSSCDTYVDLFKAFGLKVYLSEVTKSTWLRRKLSWSKPQISRIGWVETNGPNPYGFPGDRKIRIDYSGVAELLNFGPCPDDIWTLPYPKSVVDYKRRQRTQGSDRRLPYFVN